MLDPIPEGTDMQGLFEARICRRRAWLVAFVLCWAIGQIAASATCLAESVAPEPTDHLNDTPKKTPVYIVDETECKAKAYPPRPERGQKPPFGLSEAQLNAVLAWTEPEHWAWDQIC